MVIGLIGVLGYLPFFMIIMSVENIKCRLEKIRPGGNLPTYFIRTEK
jgi:hypothetical protein